MTAKRYPSKAVSWVVVLIVACTLMWWLIPFVKYKKIATVSNGEYPDIHICIDQTEWSDPYATPIYYMIEGAGFDEPVLLGTTQLSGQANLSLNVHKSRDGSVVGICFPHNPSRVVILINFDAKLYYPSLSGFSGSNHADKGLQLALSDSLATLNNSSNLLLVLD